ncbi:MAG: HPP family protein [Deltaproteobacteria bacterium]|nr:HPP family protein [Deltaproteobacteria bacterium]
MEYINKMKGISKSPPSVDLSEILWSWIGAFLGITPIAIINYHLFTGTDLVMIIGSFGASGVLGYGAIRSPLAQPRNLIGGHVISAIIGVAAYKVMPHYS